MALQTNRQQSLVNSGKKIKTVAEYLEPLLAANIPLEEIEELLTEEVAELESKLRETTDDASKEKIEFALKNRRTILNDLKAHKTIEEALREFDEVNKKLSKEYENTIKCCEDLFDYITNIDVENEKDLTKLKKAIQDRVNSFTAQLILHSNQKDALQTAIKNLEALNPKYSLIEECSRRVAKFNAKSYEWVKAQYVASLRKIQELEEAKARIGYAHEQKQLDAIINQINKSINEDLPHVLENPRDIELIKREAYKELGIDIEHKEPIPHVIQTEEQVVETEGDNNTSKENIEQPESEKQPKIVVPPVKTKDSEDFQRAKIEYLNIIKLINEHIKHLEELNTQQDMYTFDPDENLDNMIKNFNEIEAVNKRINNLKRKKLELEYEKYINDHIMLTLDEDVQNATINNIAHNSDIVAFMEQHNEVIKYCYEQLQEIAKQDYTNNPELQSKIKHYKDVIAIQHLIINERIVQERKNDKNFDAIKFMREHRLKMTSIKFDKKEPVVEEQTPQIVSDKKPQPEPEKKVEPKIEVQPVSPEEDAYNKDNKSVVNEIIKLIEEYKKDYLLLYAQLKNIESEIGYAEEHREQLKNAEIKITAEITRMRKVILEKINTSGLSSKRQEELAETLKNTTRVVNKSVENRMITQSHLRLVELKKDVDVLLRQSQELIKLSEISVDSEEYKKALERFNSSASFLETKYTDLELKVSKQSASSIKFEYTVDKTVRKACTIATKSQKAKKTTETKSDKKQVKIAIKESKLSLKDNVADIDRRKALIDTISKIKVTLLTQKVKIEYTKQLVEDLNRLKVKLAIQASAEDKAKINVSPAKDSKDQKREYRYIDDIENLASAQIIYRDQDTGEDLLKYELLDDEELRHELENRRRMK